MKISGIKYKLSCRQVVGFFLVISIYSCKKDAPGPVSPLLYDVKVELLSQLNALRQKGCECGTDTMQAVKTVAWNDSLAKAATDHAMDMYNKNYFDHVSPTGVTPNDWAAQEGYVATDLGEDIAENYTTVSSTVTAWQNSPEHCTVMMDSVYQDVGASRYGNYWVMLMAKR